MYTRVATNTATIVIFDPSCLKHRLEDACDWWSIPDEEVAEINDGNVLFLSTGADGVYDVEVAAIEPDDGAKVVEALIKNESGRFFVGAGEYTTGDRVEPRAEYGNVFVKYPPGVYRLRAWMSDGDKVCLSVTQATEFRQNQFKDSPSIA
jgi:hypothetical protein